MKNRILLDNYYLPGQLEQSIAEFVAYTTIAIPREPRQPHTGGSLLRQRTGHYQTEENHQAKNHRTPTSPASAGKRGLTFNQMSQTLS
jgi:hypothetical protein